MKVRVTRNDIAAGINNIRHTCGCPIWHALRRHLKLRERMWDTDSELRIPCVSVATLGKVRLVLPWIAQKWQLAGMRGIPVKPFQFEIDKVTIGRQQNG